MQHRSTGRHDRFFFLFVRGQSRSLNEQRAKAAGQGHAPRASTCCTGGCTARSCRCSHEPATAAAAAIALSLGVACRARHLDRRARGASKRHLVDLDPLPDHSLTHTYTYIYSCMIWQPQQQPYPQRHSTPLRPAKRDTSERSEAKTPAPSALAAPAIHTMQILHQRLQNLAVEPSLEVPREEVEAHIRAHEVSCMESWLGWKALF